MTNKWDYRFLALAEHVAGWSKDPSTKTGAVIVHPDKTVVSFGFNGFPRGCLDNEVLYANRELKYSRIIHCEMNAILSAHGGVRGCTLYTWPFMSCDRCAAHVIQAGIVRCVAPKIPEELKERWKDSLEKATSIFAEAQVELVLL